MSDFEKLQNLLKAQEDEVIDDELLKANEEELDDEDTDDYDAEYCKKYMKRFMKENADEAKKYAGELGFLKKAVETEYENLDGIEEADAILIDGTSFIKTQSELNNAMLGVLQSIQERQEKLEENLNNNLDIVKAIGGTLVDALEAKTIAEESLFPQKRKGVVSEPQRVVTKAKETPGLVKAKDMKFGEIKRMVMKAISEDNKEAMSLAPAIDACNGNLGLLSGAALKTIDNLATKYAEQV